MLHHQLENPRDRAISVHQPWAGGDRGGLARQHGIRCRGHRTCGETQRRRPDPPRGLRLRVHRCLSRCARPCARRSTWTGHRRRRTCAPPSRRADRAGRDWPIPHHTRDAGRLLVVLIQTPHSSRLCLARHRSRIETGQQRAVDRVWWPPPRELRSARTFSHGAGGDAMMVWWIECVGSDRGDRPIRCGWGDQTPAYVGVYVGDGDRQRDRRCSSGS